MKLATFNIYWLGNDRFVPMSHGLPPRTQADWSLIERVITKLNADVLAFEEIVSLNELQAILKQVNKDTARSYQIYNGQNQLLGTGGTTEQKVVLAYDENHYELLTASTIFGVEKVRLPYAIRLRSKADGGQVMIVGVHFKSGQPQFDDADSAVKRRLQCQHLADWLAGAQAAANPVLPHPDEGEFVVVMGDFNALSELAPSHPHSWQIIVDSLDPLRAAHMQQWWWPQPRISKFGGDQISAYIDRLLIDFIMFSPSLKNRVVEPPTIYAYDQDPAITHNPNAVEYRISDHRPVYAEIDISPA